MHEDFLPRVVREAIADTSWIRDMFLAASKAKELDPDSVFDFSIGNPILEPPSAVKEAMKQLAASDEIGTHRYMNNQGLDSTRAWVAAALTAKHAEAFSKEHIVMCVGAGGGLSILLKAILEGDDEVIFIAPHFIEYGSYVQSHGAHYRRARCKEDFSLDLDAIAAQCTSKTRALIINAPNNPTGVVYSQVSLEGLANLLRAKSKGLRAPILLISDEPYAKIVFDALECPSIFKFYEQSVVVTSCSKDIALPGERIGYVAVSPHAYKADLIVLGMNTALRMLGFVNAPAFFQRLLPLVGNSCVDVSIYQHNRDLLYEHLTKVGFRCVKPQGAFYFFPQCPIADDIAFVRDIAERYKVFTVPGTAFSGPGYFRISYCVPTEMIVASLPAFTAIAQQYHLGTA